MSYKTYSPINLNKILDRTTFKYYMKPTRLRSSK